MAPSHKAHDALRRRGNVEFSTIAKYAFISFVFDAESHGLKCGTIGNIHVSLNLTPFSALARLQVRYSAGRPNVIARFYILE